MSFKNPIFMQDVASCHTSKSTIDSWNENKITIIAHWPAQSHDLNIIENVWSIIKRNIDLSEASTSQQIFEIVKKEWGINISTTNSKFDTVNGKKNASSHRCKGGNTKY